ncbi:MAG: diadenosine tetraphosphatase ApaH/serine/threonine PP2A family protein phosphatase [Verrucomicrobiales bacterium]|jgi:diadenosine tetraphosphatase ApaH/serine/threonine PP2A family protein phosphatase
MRYAIFSDIHGNAEAWERVLEDIQLMDADVLVCLGDVVGYGPLPEEVLTDIRNHTDNFVLGNHDAAAAGLLDVSYFNESAREVLEWTKKQLDPESIQFLRNVPLKITSEDILFVHAEISEPSRFNYIEEVEDAQKNFAANDHFVTFVGHTHYPLIFELTNDGSVLEHEDNDYRLSERSRYIVNVGSVGEPRNPDDLRARYLVYDSETREVFFRRVDFDFDVYRKHLAATSLTVMPFFLRVIDQLVENETEERYAMMADMNIPIASLDYLNQFSQEKEEDLNLEKKRSGGPRKRVKKRKRGRSFFPKFVFFTLLLALVGGGVWFLKFAPPEVREYVYDLLPKKDNEEPESAADQTDATPD